ncbi:hypothetical protein AVEN_92776-1 [Araneus ventricosus]|uniref:Histone-lysine N-methyltransferase SETMAR n=1 Tax=Araneus ventricosus TaxID=182803 RepID=A0A4Y2FRL6_ARAVE|nr:hypothetical protein AVEN_92776-1 [Araneus ventricosus]
MKECDDVILLHDNAMPHSARVTQQVIDSFGWEQMNYPPYSSDLAPSYLRLFLHLKRFLSGQRFEEDEKVKDALKSWLLSQAATFCDPCIQTLFLDPINVLICRLTTSKSSVMLVNRY